MEPMTTRSWPSVRAFANRMEAKLDENIHKGDRDGWLKDVPHDLLRRLREEVDELEEAMKFWGSHGADGQIPAAVDRITREAADVGNFAMMIADWYGGLHVSSQGDPLDIQGLGPAELDALMKDVDQESE